MSVVPLKVLNASAGSGKTYSLVKTFMHLLLAKDEFNPAKYGEILAMTFTNKAALEMKVRIIGALDKLTYPELYNDDSYLTEIAQELGQSTAEITHKSGKVLYHILHNYESFNVLTIDKFNLRLIRSFSKDLNLPSDFEVVINETPIIEQVVDTVLSEIGQSNQISKYIMGFVDANFEEEKSWDIRNTLIQFAKILTKEQDIPYVKQLMEKQFSIEEYNTLKSQWRNFNTSYVEKCRELHTLFLNQDPDSKLFPGGVNSRNRYVKLIEIQKLEGPAFTPTLISKLQDGEATTKGLPEELVQLSLALIAYEEQNLKNCIRLNLIIKNYFNMALLQYINIGLEEVNTNERLMRISEFNARIQKLLLQEDTLYIYEKLGVKFRHFMLDEFQDTSRLQWLNLVPLLHESISKGEENLIVGDPKQAIYRFKNGVAEQFVSLPAIYNPENDPKIAEMSTYFEKMGEVEVLPNNYRSAKEIVEFNNALFTEISNTIGEQEKTFYNNIIQTPLSKKQGYISIETFEVRTFKALEHLEFIEKSILEAQEDGYKLGDICILGSMNTSCSIWANALTTKGYKIVSADSLNIDYDQEIQLILSYFTLLNASNDENYRKQFVHNFCLAKQQNTAFYYSYFVKNEKGYTHIDLERFLIDNIEDYTSFFHKFETLYDLVQKSYSIFKLEELKNTYLHHFADMIYQFELKNGPDLPNFLKEYKTLPKESKAVQIPESDDAIKIMTIHKSKGLEFPVVILVHEVKSENNNRNHFVNDNNELIYTPLSKNSALETIVKHNDIESRKEELDKLNKYYVAYTRPEERLYLSIPFKKSTLDSKFAQFIFEGENFSKSSVNKKSIGERFQKVYPENRSASKYYNPYSNSDNLWFPDIALQDMDRLNEQDLLSEERRYGTQFHHLIANYKTAETIDAEIQSGLETGIIEFDFVERLKVDLKSVLENENYLQLFENALEILDETSILLSKNEQIRPDKIIIKEKETIVVDFKTGVPKKQDVKQLKNYKGALLEMGHTSVKGYLFYLHDKRLQEV